MAKRTAKDFSRKQIWEIANAYANTACTYSHDYFEREYEISKGTFYTLLQKAIIEHIVDTQTIELMAKKAIYNSEVKAGKAGAERSRKHYDYLIRKRVLYRLPKSQAIKWTTQYAESKCNKREFAKRKYFTTKFLDTTIKEAIIKGWVSDEVVAKLKEKSLRQNNSQSVQKFWEELETLRRNNKNQG